MYVNLYACKCVHTHTHTHTHTIYMLIYTVQDTQNVNTLLSENTHTHTQGVTIFFDLIS